MKKSPLKYLTSFIFLSMLYVSISLGAFSAFANCETQGHSLAPLVELLNRSDTAVITVIPPNAPVLHGTPFQLRLRVDLRNRKAKILSQSVIGIDTYQADPAQVSARHDHESQTRGILPIIQSDSLLMLHIQKSRIVNVLTVTDADGRALSKEEQERLLPSSREQAAGGNLQQLIFGDSFVGFNVSEAALTSATPRIGSLIRVALEFTNSTSHEVYRDGVYNFNITP